MVKIYLDDIRTAPDGWVRCHWPDEVIVYLRTGEVTELSLDHDLGDDLRGTGYDVLLWIEKEVREKNFTPPVMQVHSANGSARQRMEAAIASIQVYHSGKKFEQ